MGEECSLFGLETDRDVEARRRVGGLGPDSGRHTESTRTITANGEECMGRLPTQLTARFTSAPILASSAAVNSFSAKAVGHRWPSSRFALSLKPNVAYLVLNFCAL